MRSILVALTLAGPIHADAYCSHWPPAPVWGCYAMQATAPDHIAFEDSFGNRFEGRVEPE